MSEPPQILSLRSTLSGRWQIPTLLLGLVLLGGGLIGIATAYQPVAFPEELGRVATLRSTGALRRANAYLLNLLEDQDRPSEQRGELHRQLAGTIYQAESPLVVHTRHNVKSIIANLQAAMRYGITPDGPDWVVLGDAYRWADNLAEAADAYRQALRLAPTRPDRLRRNLVELRLRLGRPFSAETSSDLDAILEDPSASPDNFLWALEHKILWQLEQDATDAALDSVRAAAERLSGTAQRPALTYFEALCLSSQGTRYSSQAESLLRSLLNDWQPHDILWAKANWLLGKLQQSDDRPQAALSFYDQTMRTFQKGPLHDACRLGRAECLAALERHQRSLEAFAALTPRLLESPRNRYPVGQSFSLSVLDRGAVRATITAIGESLLQAGELPSGIAYLRLASDLVEASDNEGKAYYAARIAAALTELARAASSGKSDTQPDPDQSRDRQGEVPGSTNDQSRDRQGAAHARAKEFFRQAGETYLILAGLQTRDEDSAATSMELAADSFDAAGLTQRAVETLARFVREHPASDRRAAALFRLGQGYQAMKQYPQAVAAYEQAIEEYPRLLAAHSSMVPLAECLLAMGGRDAKRGADLLIGIVDDEGPESLFDPRAKEYHDALFRLAEYYTQADEQEVPGHFEKAIARLEDAVALYPDDPRITRLIFLLGDAYLQSATILREEDRTGLSEQATTQLLAEADRRLRRALEAFDRVIAALAPHDTSSLTQLDRTHLRGSYLYRADSLFDLGLHEQAIEAYNEAVWRYENLPAAISASMQIVHCHQRLGQTDQARAAIERLGWLLAKIPASAFETERGMSSKQYWENMLSQLRGTGIQ